MVVKTLNVKKDHFRPINDDEEILGQEVPYLSVMGALLFLASHTRLDILFSLNPLARYSSCPTRRHWSGVKKISLPSRQEAPIVVHEDDATCIAQHNDGYIKDLFTKALSTATFKKLVHGTGMRRLNELK
ncbi:hypothetical protein Tco_0629232 [Tanacetum coccineum]|uniref:Uncharacterized protein n=1 Tax=Tanacetum coccineum TaxID=301880 RepID=A0ABQ4WSI7_9ASTR